MSINSSTSFYRPKGRNRNPPKVRAPTDWPAQFDQRGSNQTNEAAIKAKCPSGSITASKIDSMRFPKESLFQELEKKEKIELSLNKTDKLKLKILREKQIDEINQDLANLKERKLTGQVTTNHGRIVKLLNVAMYLVSTKDSDMNNKLYYIHRSILEMFPIPVEIYTDPVYKDIFNKLEKVHSDIDTIQLQFNEYHTIMPPLNQKEFKVLDEWQLEYLDSVEKNKNIIVLAPTSAGKTVLVCGLPDALVVTISAPLAWQTATLLQQQNQDKNIPIVTESFQSGSTREELIKKIENANSLVGTAKDIVDILPFLTAKTKFKWLVFDEAHMFGTEHHKEMEVIAKYFNDVPIILLSATFGNIDEFKNWLEKIGHTDIDIIKCEKRFINLQRLVYDSTKLIQLHPLSFVLIDDIATGEILNKISNINASPPEIWPLAVKLKSNCDIGNLDPYIYFNQEKHNIFNKNQAITLDEANKYFTLLLEWMVANYKTYSKSITSILKEYNHDDLLETKSSLVDLAFLLKKKEMLPALAILESSRTDDTDCLEQVKDFSRRLFEMEDKAHPKLVKERLLLNKEAARHEKKNEKDKIDVMGEKQLQKLLLAEKKDDIAPERIYAYAPHPDFTLGSGSISETMIEEIIKSVRNFFPPSGEQEHFMIRLLRYDIGVYAKRLPEAYLQIVQNLACSGILKLVLSDDSLLFGISMPFKTVIIPQEANLDARLVVQASGRAGRRLLCPVGYVVFKGMSGKKIKELVTCPISKITGGNTLFPGMHLMAHDKRVAALLQMPFLNSKISNTYAAKFNEDIRFNLSKTGAWNFAVSDDINFTNIGWPLRQSLDCFRMLRLVPFIRKMYLNCNPVNELTQIECAHFLLQFYDIVATDTDVLPPMELCKQYNIHQELEKIALAVPKNIDSKLYKAIRQNSINTDSPKEKRDLRKRLYKFVSIIKALQHYFYYTKEVCVSRLLSKLMTRIWWIHHMSSPLMESTIGYTIPDNVELTKDLEEIELIEESEPESEEESEPESEPEKE